MKTKKLQKKLTLHKKTIADLNILEMKDIYGGVGYTLKIVVETGCGCHTFTCVPTDCYAIIC